jgi:hypothetical protein
MTTANRQSQAKWNGQTAVPKQACILSAGRAEMLAEAGQQASSGLRILAYNGEVTKHWYWGNFAVDLKGMTVEKDRIPILEEHFTDKRIGFADKPRVDASAGVIVEGNWLSNPRAQELRSDMQEGFPFQASMYAQPVQIEQLADGVTATVNGRTIEGPGAIFRASILKETSVCVFGAFSNTESSAFAAEDTVHFELTTKENAMSKDNETAAVEITAQVLKDRFAEVHAQVLAEGRAEGQTAEKERFAALQQACGDDYELLVKCFAADMTTAQAQAARIEKLSAANAEMARKLADSTQRSTRVDPAVTEFKEQKPGQAAAKFDEAKATDEQLKAHYAATAELKEQFKTADAYIAYVRHDVRKDGD